MIYMQVMGEREGKRQGSKSHATNTRLRRKKQDSIYRTVALNKQILVKLM